MSIENTNAYKMEQLVLKFKQIVADATLEGELIRLLDEVKILDKAITNYYTLVSKEQDNG